MLRIQRVFGKALVGAALALSVSVPLGAAAGGMPTDVIYNFTGGAEGGTPQAGLIKDTAGNFYGTTSGGGSSNCPFGCGAVFKVSPLGVATALYTFKGGRDGGEPQDTLIADAAGNLYGTTEFGGAHNFGVVFKLTPSGVETVLHAFAGGGDGAQPIAGLIMDAAGNFYGTTTGSGPPNPGTVFKLASDGTQTVLHAFTRHLDGYQPYDGVIMDKHGNLYGDTAFGGASNLGVIFKIAPNGKFSLLYSFTDGADGEVPQGGLIMNKQGALYGTTTEGGGPCLCGVVFRLAPDGTETVLHTFTGSDGADPTDSLIMDKQGALYGTTNIGGRHGDGTVFQLSPDGTETVLYSFAGSPDGAGPNGSLLLYMNKLYGTTASGGSGHRARGVVFEVRKAK